MIIERPSYMDQLREAEGTHDIKVLTGIRRSGKSTLLRSFADDLRRRNPRMNLIHIDYNVSSFEAPATGEALYHYVMDAHEEDALNVLMIDEVQMCAGFERALNALHASEKFDIYITGSNAFFLSSNLATLFTGRTYTIPVWPFSLKEYMQYWQIPDPREAFARFRLEGGMPGSFDYGTPASHARYLREVWQTLIARDVMDIHTVRNESLLESLTEFLLSNIANVTSAKNIETTLRSAGRTLSNKTVDAYLQYLVNAYAFCKVRRYDTTGKRYLTYGSKYYLTDHAFRFAVLGTRNMDFGRVSENIVATELQRRGYEIYAGTMRDKEIDFVAMRPDEVLYIQVCEDISSPETFEREIRPFLSIRDRWPCLLLANTHQPAYSHDGIMVRDLASWLAGS